jgi:hypothetical protein
MIANNALDEAAPIDLKRTGEAAAWAFVIVYNVCSSVGSNFKTLRVQDKSARNSYSCSTWHNHDAYCRADERGH